MWSKYFLVSRRRNFNLKKNPAVKDVDADFSIGVVSRGVVDKNINGFKLKNGIAQNKIFLDWLINRNKLMRISVN